MDYTAANILSVIAAIFGSLSMICYLIQLVKGESIPNPATWIIWLVIGVINATTYFLVVHGSLLRSVNLMIVTFGIFAVTVYAAIFQKFSKIKIEDKVCLAIALMVCVLWKATGNAAVSNLILQGVYLISFIPTVMGLKRGEIKERPLPWALAVCSYLLMICVVGLTWSGISWVALAHPILNGLVGNGLVTYYAFPSLARY